MTTEEFSNALQKAIKTDEYMDRFYDENVPKYHLARPGLEPSVTMPSKRVLWWGRVKLKIRFWKLRIMSRL